MTTRMVAWAAIAAMAIGASAEAQQGAGRTDRRADGRTGRQGDARAVRVWEGVLSLPTFDEGPTDPNPPFDLLQPAGRPNYPYTMRTELTDRRRDVAHRAIWLENEYLKCAVLPDVGGHLYSCTDKVNGQEMFYANSALKVSNIAYRGSWAAFGIEFNFPVSHNWMTTSPVDWAMRQEPDGGASVFVGNTDRPYGMRWVVQLTLRPGRAVLEQQVTLTNASDLRQRFYWWTNAGVRAFDDTKILYPMKYSASHGFTDVDTWPVNRLGTDNSVLRNHVYGPVSRFAHGSREGYMAIWQPRTNAGVAHFAPPDELPAKKIWSWGVDADAYDWRRALSIDSSAYVEIQAGLFRDQETYAWLEPHDRITFHEYWLPVRELGGVTRVTPRAVLRMWRDDATPNVVHVAMNPAVASRNSTISVTVDGTAHATRRADLTPRSVFTLDVTSPRADGPVGVAIADASGATIVAHVEDRFDFTPDSLIHPGPQLSASPAGEAGAPDGAFLSIGEGQDVNGDALGAWARYRAGLASFPTSLPLLKAAGRSATRLMRWTEGEGLLARYLKEVPSDHEAAYYRGVALRALGRTREARLAFEFARQYGPLAPSAERSLAMIEAQGGEKERAAERMMAAAARYPDLRVDAAILSRAVRANAGTARTLVDAVLADDPTNNLARYERMRLAGKTVDRALVAHLAADAERVRAIASRYIDYGLYEDALGVLDREYPAPSSPRAREAGAPGPGEHAMVAYMTHWVKQQLGLPSEVTHDRAMALSLRGIFPQGERDEALLRAAVAGRPSDQGARFLLGMLDMQRGDVGVARARWDSVRTAGSTFPSLWRNLASAQLMLGDARSAEATFDEGTVKEPDNTANWAGLDSTMILRGAPAADRAKALDRYADRAAMPTTLVYRYVLALAAAGRFDDAEVMFMDRWFSRVEGGTNPRGVWLDVRTQRAQERARAGACMDVRAIIASLVRPIPRRSFTNDGMAPFLEREPVKSRLRELDRACPAGR